MPETGFECAACGRHHPELPRSYALPLPELCARMSPEEQARRCEISEEWCVVDGQHHFVRTCLEIPVRDDDGPLVWIVWASLSPANFERTMRLWHTPGRETEPPYFGWFSSSLPGYPETLSLKSMVHTRPVGERPWVELEPTDHPLAVEQRVGISAARLREIAAAALHAGE